jgi:pyruvate/2-oxoglutarate/acetoin dehydrogenase E1 component
LLVPVISGDHLFVTNLLSCYTMSGSFLLSFEKPREEYASIAYAMQTTIAIPTAIYGMLPSVEFTVIGFMIVPRIAAKIIIPNVR